MTSNQLHVDLPLRSPRGSGAMSKEARRLRRQKRDAATKKEKQEGSDTGVTLKKQPETEKLLQFLSKNEDELLDFVVNVDKLYKDKLKKDAPFMTFVLVGMQSSGKSTFMERLLNAVVNIVQEGTGTRCPLDVTCVVSVDVLFLEIFLSSMMFTDTVFDAHHHISFSFIFNSMTKNARPQRQTFRVTSFRDLEQTYRRMKSLNASPNTARCLLTRIRSARDLSSLCIGRGTSRTCDL
jgi:Dynamin family